MISLSIISTHSAGCNCLAQRHPVRPNFDLLIVKYLKQIHIGNLTSLRQTSFLCVLRTSIQKSSSSYKGPCHNPSVEKDIGQTLVGYGGTLFWFEILATYISSFPAVVNSCHSRYTGHYSFVLPYKQSVDGLGLLANII